MISCLAVTLHELDYPFLRHLDEYAALGFTIAIVVVFAMSINDTVDAKSTRLGGTGITIALAA